MQENEQIVLYIGLLIENFINKKLCQSKASLITDCPLTSFTTMSEKKSDMLHMTHDSGHVTHDM